MTTPFHFDHQIHRYPLNRVAMSALDVYIDVVNWITGLTSKGVLTDILHERHGMKDRSGISKAADEIQAYVRPQEWSPLTTPSKQRLGRLMEE
jgi:hypothetical protein